MNAPDSDKLIWLEFKGGNQQALQQLYKQHYLGLINYGIKTTGDRAKANDYIIEMLLALWEKKERLPEVENVRSYLLTCLRNTIFQRIRSEKLREVKETHAYSLTDQFEFSYDEYIGKVQTDAIIKSRLLKCMDKLTQRQKQLLELKFFDDLSYDEIAERCEISKRTAYNIIYDALKIMKNELSGVPNEDLKDILPFLTVITAQLLVLLS
jgi:RNA polymerase sigma factor (sigma-70 family)